jgi:hypothetical protein
MWCGRRSRATCRAAVPTTARTRLGISG